MKRGQIRGRQTVVREILVHFKGRDRRLLIGARNEEDGGRRQRMQEETDRLLRLVDHDLLVDSE